MKKSIPRPVIVDASIILDMEQAKDQNAALHYLLIDAFSNQDRNGSSYGEQTLNGITLIMCDVHAKMDRVYDALESARQAASAKHQAQN